jgi:two-component system, NarL family, invasion response regulator UvrY
VIRVLLADDHAVVREGLRRILAEQGDFQVAAEATNGEELLRAVATVPVDVVVLDVSMPGPGVFELLRRLTADHPRVRVVVLTVHPEEQYAIRVLRAGAAGYVSKERSSEFLVDAIRKVQRGGLYVGERLAELLAARAAGRVEREPHDTLSDRELEVLRRLGAGQSVKAMAADLGLSRKTVSTYRSRVCRKLRVQSDAELIRYVLEHALLG